MASVNKQIPFRIESLNDITKCKTYEMKKKPG